MNLPYERRNFDEHIDEMLYMALSIADKNFEEGSSGTLEEFYGDEFWSRLTPFMAKHIYFRFINTCENYGYQLYQDLDRVSCIFVKTKKPFEQKTYFEADEL